MSDTRNSPNHQGLESLVDALISNLVECLITHCKSKDKQQINQAIDKLQNAELKNLTDVLAFTDDKITEGIDLISYACKHGNIALCTLLLRNFNIENSKADFRFAYFLVCNSNKSEHKIIAKLLLTNNVPVGAIEWKKNQFSRYFETTNIATNSIDINDLQKVLSEKRLKLKAIYTDPIYSFLLQASKNGHIDMVEHLLKNITPKQLNFTSSLNVTSLLMAVGNGHIEIVNMLLAKGADIEIANGEDLTTPLIMAIFKKHTQIVKLLLEYNADIYKANSSLQTPFMAACGSNILEIVTMVLDKCPEDQRKKLIDQKDSLQWTGLFFACSQNGKNNIEIIQTLIANNADIHVIDWDGISPLMIAAGHGHTPTVELLLKHGADINLTDRFGNTPLIYACKGGHAETATTLLRSGASLYHVNKENNSAMQCAIINDHYSTLTALLSELTKDYEKAELEKDNDPDNQFEMIIARLLNYFWTAITNNKPDLAKLLLKDHETELLLMSAIADKPELISQILEVQRVATLEENGLTMLEISIRSGNLSAAKFLLDKGLPIKQAISFACEANEISSLEYFVKSAKISLIDIDNPELVDGKCANNFDFRTRLMNAIKAVDASKSKGRSKHKPRANTTKNVDDITPQLISAIRPIHTKRPVQITEQNSNEAIKSIKLLFWNNVSDNDISWIDIDDDRHFNIQLPKDLIFIISKNKSNDNHSQPSESHSYQLSSDAIRKLLNYIKKNLENNHIQLYVKNESEIEIIIKIGQQMIIDEKMKERISKLISEYGIHIYSSTKTNGATAPSIQAESKSENKQQSEETMEHFNQCDDDKIDESLTLINPNTQSSKHPLELNDDEEITKQYIAKLLFSIANVETRLPLCIRQHLDKKSKWIIYCRANQVGIGSKPFFTSIVNSINHVFPKEFIAKTFGSANDEINMVIDLKKHQVISFIEKLQLLQDRYKFEYENQIKLREELQNEQKISQATPLQQQSVISHESTNTTDKQQKKKKKIKKKIENKNKKTDTNAIIEITEQCPSSVELPTDVKIAESHVIFLHAAYKNLKSFKQNQVDPNNNASDQDTELACERLHRHVYMSMLKLIKVLYNNHRALGIECNQLENTRLLFTHRIDLILNLNLFQASFLDINNNNALVTIMTDAYNSLVNYYSKGQQIKPALFIRNQIYQTFCAQPDVMMQTLIPPPHQNGGKGLIQQLILKCEHLKYLSLTNAFSLQLLSDPTLLDTVQSLIFELGSLVRQMREQEVGFCKTRLGIKLSLSEYHDTLFTDAATISGFESVLKTTKENIQYRELLPQIIAIYNKSPIALMEFLGKLNFNEALLVCIEMRNFMAHKQINRQKLFSGTSANFYLYMTNYLSATLLPKLYESLKLSDAQDDAKKDKHNKPPQAMLFTHSIGASANKVNTANNANKANKATNNSCGAPSLKWEQKR